MTLPTSGPACDTNPEFFQGRPQISAFEPYPMNTGTLFNSLAPAVVQYDRWYQPYPLTVNNIVFMHSLNASVPGATSQNSSGTEYHSYGATAAIFSRQDYGANSTNLTVVATGSLGVTAKLTYSSISQSFAMSWVTDTTGGVATFSTSSNAGNWSSYATGVKYLSIPLASTLSQGEYWLGLQHSSTTATTGSNVTLMSYSYLIGTAQMPVPGVLGSSGTFASLVQDFMVNNGMTTTAAMPMSAFSSARPAWFALNE